MHTDGLAVYPFVDLVSRVHEQSTHGHRNRRKLSSESTICKLYLVFTLSASEAKARSARPALFCVSPVLERSTKDWTHGAIGLALAYARTSGENQVQLLQTKLHTRTGISQGLSWSWKFVTKQFTKPRVLLHLEDRAHTHISFFFFLFFLVALMEVALDVLFCGGSFSRDWCRSRPVDDEFLEGKNITKVYSSYSCFSIW